MPYIAIIPNYWGKHNIAQEALRLAKAAAGARKGEKIPYAIYEVEDDAAYCNEIDGAIMHRRGTKVALFEKYEPPKKKK